MLPDLGDWLQFCGALLGALVAVGLWVAETFRRRREIREQSTQQKHEFRTALYYALNELATQLNQAVVSAVTLRGNAQRVASTAASGQAQAESELYVLVQGMVLSTRVQLAPILEISVDHARFLTSEENRYLAEIVTSSRAINTAIGAAKGSTDSVPQVVDALHVVVDVAEDTSRQIDSLTASLQGHRHGLQ